MYLNPSTPHPAPRFPASPKNFAPSIFLHSPHPRSSAVTSVVVCPCLWPIYAFSAPSAFNVVDPKVDIPRPLAPHTSMPPPDPRDDAALISALTRGDPSAFDTLYARHRNYVFSLALRFTANADDALDVLQETWAYVARKAATGHFELTAAMTTFLYPVVKNTAIAIRKKKRRQPPLPDALAQTHPAPPIPPDASATRAQLAAVLATLPETHREVVLLRFVDDLSLEEIATALAIPLGTVKSRLHHALATLRQDPRTRHYFSIDETTPQPPPKT